MNNKIKYMIAAGSIAAVLATGAVQAQEKAKSLDELLNFVKSGRTAEASENAKREAEFKQAKNQQAAMLAKSKKTRTAEEARSVKLEKTFEDNDVEVEAKKKQLKERLGSLTELFGHLTSSAGDLRSTIEGSYTSVQFQDRDEFLDDLVEKMSGSDKLPSIEEIERLWFELQREATETGRVVKFTAPVSKLSGEQVDEEVVRVGVFNLVSSDGKYLTMNADYSLGELARQPGSNYVSMAASLAAAGEGLTRFGVDPTGPSGGSFLSALIDSPTLVERWHQGGIVGYIITGVGVFAVLLAIWRFIVLAGIGSKVNSQLKSDKANTNNPLGRVLAVQEGNPSIDAETLELKLNEAVLKETPAIESSLTLLKIIAAVAPLLGLLGTVTGMIITFQAITIFGAGDPKAMAGGISSALVTTVLGLCVAIPTVLLHTLVSGRAKRIVHILDEQAAGIIARQNEVKS